METAGYNSWVDVEREQREGDDSDGILENRDREDSQYQDQSSPPGSQKQVTREQTGDKEREAGADAAALFAHFNYESGKGE